MYQDRSHQQREPLAGSCPLTHTHFFHRCGLALALNKLSQCLDSSQVKPLFQFFVPDALNDRNADVRKCMLDAALATLNAHGKVKDFSHLRGWEKAVPRQEVGLNSGDSGRPSARNLYRALAPMENFIYVSFEQKRPQKGVKFLQVCCSSARKLGNLLACQDGCLRAHSDLVLGQRLSFPDIVCRVLWVHLDFQENVNSLLPVFEEFLKNAPNDASYDAVRQSVVVLMGSLAKHLDKSDPKVKPIVAKLIAALSTPSQQVPATCPEVPTARVKVGYQGPKGPVSARVHLPLTGQPVIGKKTSE